MADISSIFVRELEINNSNSLLKISQCFVGDVGCVAWDAGIALAKYLDHSVSEGKSLRNKSIVDLGSGTGVVGLFAASLGAQVVLTDLPEVIPLLKTNIENNKDVITGSAEAKTLCWGESIQDFEKPDIVLVADCIYYEKSLDLICTLRQLSANHTEILISYEHRTSTQKQNLIHSFLKALKNNFVVELIPESDQHPEFCSFDIHLLKCKLL